jgi:hypothetical protein
MGALTLTRTCTHMLQRTANHERDTGWARGWELGLHDTHVHVVAQEVGTAAQRCLRLRQHAAHALSTSKTLLEVARRLVKTKSRRSCPSGSPWSLRPALGSVILHSVDLAARALASAAAKNIIDGNSLASCAASFSARAQTDHRLPFPHRRPLGLISSALLHHRPLIVSARDRRSFTLPLELLAAVATRALCLVSRYTTPARACIGRPRGHRVCAVNESERDSVGVEKQTHWACSHQCSRANQRSPDVELRTTRNSLCLRNSNSIHAARSPRPLCYITVLLYQSHSS